MKVYWVEIDGLHDWVVAAPNQRAALDALDVHQNLFAQGRAGLATDKDAVAAALARPLQPFKKLRGAAADWSVSETADGGWSQALEATPARPKPKRPVSRAALDRAEAALAKAKADSERRIAGLIARRSAIEAQIAAETADRDQRLKTLEATRAAAERAFRH